MAVPRGRRAAGKQLRRQSPGALKYVYSFANGKAEGSSAMRALLGGKGCELAEMTKLGVPVPPGLTITTEAWAAYQAAGKKQPPGLWDQIEHDLERLGSGGGEPARRSRASAPRVRALGRARVDARHDGHRAESRAQRRDGRRARAPDQERALRLGLLPPLHHDLRRRRARHRSPRLRRSPRPRQGADGGEDRRRGRRRGAQRAGRRVQAPRPGADGQALPAGPGRAAAARHQRRLRLVVGEEGGGLPAHPPAVRRVGHRGDRDGHGVRQPRGHLRHRRLLLAGSVDAASGASSASSSSTRRARTSWRASARRSTSTTSSGACRRSTRSSSAIKDKLERHYRDMQDIEFTVQDGRLYILQTRSGKRTARGGGAHRRRDGQGGAVRRPRHQDPARARERRSTRPCSASSRPR